MGTADAIAVAVTSPAEPVGWLFAGGWFVFAGLCALRARQLARAS